MKITVPKSTLETALAPILKMAPAAKPSRLAARAERQKVWICRSTGDQRLDIELPDAACDQKDGGFGIAGLESFRLMVSAARGTCLSIEQDAGTARLHSDGSILGLLDSEPAVEDSEFQMPKECDSAMLPTSFANFVLQAFACAGNDRERPALSGVNVSPRGIAGTDGKQLFHLPLPLHLREDVTLPPSKAYAALTGRRWTSLAHWKTADGARMFRIEGDGFRYTARALAAVYPHYWNVIPKDGGGPSFSLDEKAAASLQAFLGGCVNGATAKLTVHPDRIAVEETDGSGVTRRMGVFGASGSGSPLPHAVRLDTRYLGRFLKMGFRSMSLPPQQCGPLVSSAGTGVYVFMSLSMEACDAATPSTPVPESKPATAIPSQPETTPQPEEQKTMTQTVNTNTATTSPTAFTRMQSAVQSNPLDETLSSLVSMRETLSGLEARLLEAGRRIKAALVEQRLKERQYADATRKLERIRLAV